jgi:hypothetical protein
MVMMLAPKRKLPAGGDPQSKSRRAAVDRRSFQSPTASAAAGELSRGERSDGIVMFYEAEYGFTSASR